MPWISPAKFRPELVPEELMAPVLTVRAEIFLSFKVVSLFQKVVEKEGLENHGLFSLALVGKKSLIV